MMFSQYNERLRALGESLDNLNPGNVFHYRRPDNMDDCIIWQEDGEDDGATTDNGIAEFVVHGTIDRYTKTEYDPTTEALIAFLHTTVGITSRVVQILYEDETGRIHTEIEFWLF